MASIWNPLRNMQAQRRRGDALYRGLMAAALAPEPYAMGVVRDDMEHRVQMVSLHAALLVWELSRRPQAELRRLVQPLHTRVFDGFDASFRETGVGDASIAQKVRKLGEHYYGLGMAVAGILSAQPANRAAGLTELLQRNGVTLPGREGDLACHIADLANSFEGAPSEAFLAGHAPWRPYPATSRHGVAKV